MSKEIRELEENSKRIIENMLILVHIVYVLIRWYVKGCMRSRGYY